MAIVLAAVIQSTTLPHLAIVGVKIDLVVLLVVACSIRRGIELGLIWAVIGGIALDVLSAGPFGVSVIGCTVAALVAGSFGPTLRRTSALLPLALTPLASILATLATAVAMALVGWPILWPQTVALVVLPSALLNSLAMFLVYPIVVEVDDRLAVSDWPG